MVDLVSLSHTIGWAYVFIWGLSNYPTIISNIRFKSVQGISIDYMFFNAFGFLLYVLYTGSMYCSPLVREEFKLEVGGYPLIKLNDLIFGCHNLFTNLIILSQAFFWNFKRNDNQKLSRSAKIIISIIFGYLVFGGLYIHHNHKWEPVPDSFNWVYIFTSLGLIKIFMSVCKNIPQILYNYNRKSTHGWPILMVWLDFVGAFLSFIQLLLDSYEVGNMMAVFDNLPKFLLAIQVFIADAVFFTQHYWLYYDNDVSKYGPLKTGMEGYGAAVQEDEEFLLEHAHDHDHSRAGSCHVSIMDKGELQRLIN